MSIVLGVDVGGSTTKIVGFENGELLGTLQVRAADQITSLYGAIGNYLRVADVKLVDVSKIALTGVGASFIDEPIYGIPTTKVDEFLAIGHGALYLTGLKEALVVSLGTGTAFVRAGPEGIVHIGGSGMGGGTIVGLASQMLNKSDIDAVIAMAENGSLSNVDLLVSDIIGSEISSLPPDLTAANFGKIKSTATEADLAQGILNMVFQTAGMLAVFAARNDTIRDVVLIGTLTTFPQALQMQSTFNKLYGLNFVIPPHAVFATAIGAARGSV
ncbi:MAG: type II pantothenate kinase [Oscillospiraceae bacterium]|nr:type II pantothenate kinase [Oscillospiraceae bacterium]